MYKSFKMSWQLLNLLQVVWALYFVHSEKCCKFHICFLVSIDFWCVGEICFGRNKWLYSQNDSVTDKEDSVGITVVSPSQIFTMLLPILTHSLPSPNPWLLSSAITNLKQGEFWCHLQFITFYPLSQSPIHLIHPFIIPRLNKDTSTL